MTYLAFVGGSLTPMLLKDPRRSHGESCGTDKTAEALEVSQGRPNPSTAEQ